MSSKGAAEVLGLSLRHVTRILAAYRKEGAAASRLVIEEESLIMPYMARWSALTIPTMRNSICYAFPNALRILSGVMG